VPAFGYRNSDRRSTLVGTELRVFNNKGCLNSSSDCVMQRHDEVEAVLHALQEVLPVIDVDAELPLKGIVNEHARPDVDLVVLTVPVGLEGHWYSVPPVRVDVSQSCSHAFHHSLRNDMGLNRRFKGWILPARGGGGGHQGSRRNELAAWR